MCIRDRFRGVCVTEVGLELLDVLELFLGVLGGHPHGHDHAVAGLPVGRGGDGVGIGGLECVDHADDLVEVAAYRLGVGEHEAQFVLGIDDEHRADGGRVTLAGVDHVVQLGDLVVGVGNDREVERGTRDLANVCLLYTSRCV